MTKRITPTITMRKADAKKWLNALRSGKYKQTTGTLEDNDFVDGARYCCLGVLQCELTGKVQDLDLPSLGWLKKHKIDVVIDQDSLNEEDINTKGKVLKTATVDIRLDPPIRKKNGENFDSVSALNDSGVFSFKKIANILDKRIKRV